ncbi:MAG: MarR family winged helix-turn-helix transcriptional regulator [Bacteroidales bacterium]
MLSRSLGKRLEKKLSENTIDITAEQWSVLSLLFHKNKLTQVQIGNILGLDKVKVLRIVRHLENKNLLKRVISTTDKRYNNVYLTPEGSILYHQIVPFALEVHKEAFDSIHPDNISLCIDIMTKINNNLE